MVRGTTRDLRNSGSESVMNLKAIGITIAKDGTLTLDEAAFDKGLADAPGAAARLFSADGMAGRLQGVVDRLVDPDAGLLAGRSANLDARDKALASQRSARDFRMSQAEARYRAPVTAPDVLPASPQTSSDFLSQQIAALNNKTT